jgi:hypothetical protein
MIQKCQLIGISSLVLIGFSLSGLAGVANAMKPEHSQSPQSSGAKPHEHKQQGDRKTKGHRIDFAAAAAKLGTTEAKLKALLGVPVRRAQTCLDIKGTAAKLGVTEQKLIEALGLPAKLPMQGESGQMSQPK